MSDPHSPSRWRPGVADLVFLLVALMALQGSRQTLLDDPGLGWHLRNLDAILDRGWWLTEDPFTDPRGEAPARWYSNQWLGELPYWLGWRWAGLEGIATVNAIVLAVLAGALYRVLLADGLVWPVALAWTTIGVMGTSCSWNARPNVFSILFLLVTSRACVLLHEGTLSRRAEVGLVLMFAAWANTHGGFVAGLVTLLATLGIELAIAVAGTDAETRGRGRQRLSRIAILSACAFAATLVNPYGLGLYRWVSQLLGNSFFMTLHQEWRSPDFQSGGAIRYELPMLLFPFVLALSARRPSLVEVSLAVLWLHFALTGFRYVALWVVVAVPLMGRASVEIAYLRDLAKRLQLNAEPGSLYHTPLPRATWLWSVMLALLLFGVARTIQGRFAFHTQEIIASKALDQFLDLARDWRERHGRPPGLLHDYRWGGYVTWHGWPEVLNWIDDRNEVQGQKHIEEHVALMEARPGWEAKIARIDLVCIDPRTELARALRGLKDRWEALRSDDPHAVIFVRRKA